MITYGQNTDIITHLLHIGIQTIITAFSDFFISIQRLSSHGQIHLMTPIFVG